MEDDYDCDSDGWHTLRSEDSDSGSDLDAVSTRVGDGYSARSASGTVLYALSMISSRCGSIAADASLRRDLVAGAPQLMHMALVDTQNQPLTSDQRQYVAHVLETLPTLGARTDVVDPESGGMTVLGLAVKMQRAADVYILARHAVREGTINARMASGCTAVAIALERMLTSARTSSAAVDSRRILKTLLDAGADVTIGPPTGVSPLRFVRRASPEIRAAFLQAAHGRDDILNAIDANRVAYDLTRSGSKHTCLAFVQVMHSHLDRTWRSDEPPRWALVHAVFRYRFYHVARLLMTLGWDVSGAVTDNLDTCAHVLVRGCMDDGAAHDMWVLADENPRVDPFRGLPFDVPNADGHTAIDVCLREGSMLLAAQAITYRPPWDGEGRVVVDSTPERARVYMSAMFLAAVWRDRVDVMSRCASLMDVHPSALRPTPYTDIIREAVLADAAKSLSWLLARSTLSWEGTAIPNRSGAVAEDSVCQLLPPPLQAAAASERTFTVLFSHMLDHPTPVPFADMHNVIPLLFRAGNLVGIDAVCARGMVPPTIPASALLRMAVDAERNLLACVEFVLERFGEALDAHDIEDAYIECVMRGYTECVGVLLRAGARPEAGWAVAVRSERYTLVQAILDGVESDGARKRLVSSPIDRSEHGDDDTPLMHAAMHGCSDLMRVLLDAGGDEVLSDDVGAWTGVIRALSNRLADACASAMPQTCDVQDLCACLSMIGCCTPAHD